MAAAQVGRLGGGPAGSHHHRAVVQGLDEGQKVETGRSQELSRLVGMHAQLVYEAAAALRALARAIARDRPLWKRVLGNAGKRPAGHPPERTAVATIQPDCDPRLAMPGSWIMKRHKGKTRAVRVLEEGRFEHEGAPSTMTGGASR